MKVRDKHAFSYTIGLTGLRTTFDHKCHVTHSGECVRWRRQRQQLAHEFSTVKLNRDPKSLNSHIPSHLSRTVVFVSYIFFSTMQCVEIQKSNTHRRWQHDDRKERNATTATANELNKYLCQNEKSTSFFRIFGFYCSKNSSTAMKIYGFFFVSFRFGSHSFVCRRH